MKRSILAVGALAAGLAATFVPIPLPLLIVLVTAQQPSAQQPTAGQGLSPGPYVLRVEATSTAGGPSAERETPFEAY